MPDLEEYSNNTGWKTDSWEDEGGEGVVGQSVCTNRGVDEEQDAEDDGGQDEGSLSQHGHLVHLHAIS